ncbi:MAG: ATPase, partial [Alphaproteobacteria bacterium]|nr:ATPase [Alphaproteobacteria bacterium]
PDFLQDAWDEYLRKNNVAADKVDPDAFVRWTYARALAHRQPRYREMAENWGITLKAADVAGIRTPDDLDRLIMAGLEARA